MSEISADLVLRFASWLFHVRGLTSDTVNTHVCALKLPLRVGLNIVVDQDMLDLMKRGFFRVRPRVRRSIPSWPLKEVLVWLEDPKFVEEEYRIFEKAVFLLALASGLRVSQLAALTRHQSLTSFEAGDAAVSLAPSPTFLGKNERVGHRLGPVRVPAWLVEGVHHALCPVAALRRYLALFPGVHERFSWQLESVYCVRFV